MWPSKGSNATDVYDKDNVYARGEFPSRRSEVRGTDSQARFDRDRTEPEIRRIFCSAPTAGKRRIYGRFHGISPDRPGPSKKTLGPPELIIRTRAHTPRVLYLSLADVVAFAEDRQPFSGPRTMIKGTRPGETNSTNLFICRAYRLSRLIARPLSSTRVSSSDPAGRSIDRATGLVASSI